MLPAFAKLPIQFGFSIQYTDKVVNIRHYYPNFVVRLDDGKHWVVETKGRENIQVALKDAAAINWCERATELTEAEWNYIKVLQKDYEELRPSDFEELITEFHILTKNQTGIRATKRLWH